MSKITELKHKRAAAYDKMKGLNATAKKENRGLNSDEQTQWDGWDSEMDGYDAEIQRLEKFEAREKQMATNQFNAGGGERRKDDEPKMTRDQVVEAVLRYGKNNLSADMQAYIQEQRAATDTMTTLVDAEGGYAVSEDWATSLIKEMKKYGQVIDVVSDFPTSTGVPLHFTTADDTANKGRIIGESAAAVRKNLNLGRVSLNSYKYTSDIIPISFELLRDSVFPMVTFINEMAGERLGRALSEHIIIGDGNGKPQGIVPGAGQSKIAAAPDSITFNDLLELEHAINSAYRGSSCMFGMSDQTLKLIKKLDIGSNDARPLFLPSVREGEPDTILGYKYFIADEMEAVATGLTPIVFGDLSKYRLRRVGSPRFKRLDELGAVNDETQFLAFASYDGKVMQPNAFAKLQMA